MTYPHVDGFGSQLSTVLQEKILRGYSMIDNGEMDWKVIVIDVNDERAADLVDAEDIDKFFPNKTQQMFNFMSSYKVSEGKPQSQFGFGGKLLGKLHLFQKKWHLLILCFDRTLC